MFESRNSFKTRNPNTIEIKTLYLFRKDLFSE